MYIKYKTYKTSTNSRRLAEVEIPGNQPIFFTLALQEVRRLRSRSVAVSESLSPPASNG